MHVLKWALKRDDVWALPITKNRYSVFWGEGWAHQAFFIVKPLSRGKEIVFDSSHHVPERVRRAMFDFLKG